MNAIERTILIAKGAPTGNDNAAGPHVFVHGRIVKQGMGGFLNPPTHPEHTHSIHVAGAGDYALGEGEGMSWLHPDTRAKAKKMLDDWSKTKPSLDDPQTQSWVFETRVNMRHDDDPDENRATRHIRQYYPEYAPKKWGQKSS